MPDDREAIIDPEIASKIDDTVDPPTAVPIPEKSQSIVDVESKVLDRDNVHTNRSTQRLEFRIHRSRDKEEYRCDLVARDWNCSIDRILVETTAE